MSAESFGVGPLGLWAHNLSEAGQMDAMKLSLSSSKELILRNVPMKLVM